MDRKVGRIRKVGGLIDIRNNNFASIESMREQLSSTNVKKNKAPVQGTSFAELLQKNQQKAVEKEELRFSKHANERLASRQIDLSTEQVRRLEEGTSKARAKGIQESLVMVDDLAFIVNVKNNTVITAVKDTEDAVFTNIDGAVIG